VSFHLPALKLHIQKLLAAKHQEKSYPTGTTTEKENGRQDELRPTKTTSKEEISRSPQERGLRNIEVQEIDRHHVEEITEKTKRVAGKERAGCRRKVR
jgi:anti-sigma28 factor (negative regulator of flagellin synthesis)